MTNRLGCIGATRLAMSALAVLVAFTGSAPVVTSARDPFSYGSLAGRLQGALGASLCAATPCIYVADNATKGGSDSVTVYPAGANGNVVPIAIIKGPLTGLNQPNGVVRDSSGNVYVANGGNQSITVYAATSNGNVAPIQRIKGSNTGLLFVEGIALDESRNIYVATFGYFPVAVSSILVFAAGANGNVAPIRTISGSNTGLNWPQGIALDAAGAAYVANDRVCIPNYGCTGINSVTVYRPGANGNVKPLRVIKGRKTGLNAPFGLALDTGGRLYVVNYNARLGSKSVTLYKGGADGNVAPLATISGSKTGLDDPWGIALDAGDNIYVTNGTNSVTVYKAGADGNVAPIRTISGSKTALNYPQGIAVH